MPECLPEQLLCTALGRSPCARSASRAGAVARCMRAAFEIGDAEPDMAEERGHARDVKILALVAGAGERQFLVLEREAVDGARRDHGQRLHRFDRRAREHRPFDIAGRGDDRARRVDDDEGAAMAVLDPVAAGHLGEDGICVHEKNGLRDLREGHQEAGKVNVR